MNTHRLDTWAFYWSEARLLIAAIALILGGVPPLLAIAPSSMMGVAVLLVTLGWIISGLASLYLLYRWWSAGQTVFGGKETRDIIAFFVMVVSGINLGLVPFAGNIGMSISSNYVVFIIAALVYIAAAVQLYRRYKATAGALFS